MNILVTIPVDESYKKQFEAAAPNCSFRYKDRMIDEVKLTDDDLEWTEISLGNLTLQELEKAENLKWMQTASAGVEMYVKESAMPTGVKLTNASGAYGVAIAEHMLGMHLEIIKKLELYRDNQANCHWESCGNVKSILGATVLVLGMGDIGGEYAKRVKALGAYVIGMRRAKREKPDYVDEIITLNELDEALGRADVVAMSLPGTEQTHGLISAERIEKMKDGAVILNVGRGTAIDTEALCDALENGKLMGAGLDVTEPEPLPKEHRLWKIPTAVITPHISGFFHLKHTHDKIVEIMAENLKRFVNGEELINQVDFETGYKKTE